MEMIKTNAFDEMSVSEMQQVDGGAIPALVIVGLKFVGKAVAWGAISGAAGWGTKRLLDWAF